MTLIYYIIMDEKAMLLCVLPRNLLFFPPPPAISLELVLCFSPIVRRRDLQPSTSRPIYWNNNKLRLNTLIEYESETENWSNYSIFVYLPRLVNSPRNTAERMVVMTKQQGVAMAKNTGPFFSMHQACK